MKGSSLERQKTQTLSNETQVGMAGVGRASGKRKTSSIKWKTDKSKNYDI